VDLNRFQNKEKLTRQTRCVVYVQRQQKMTKTLNTNRLSSHDHQIKQTVITKKQMFVNSWISKQNTVEILELMLD